MTYISIDIEPHISLVLSNANVPFIAKLGEVAVSRFVSRISHPRSSSTVVRVPPAGNGKKVGVCQTTRTPNQPNFPHRPERESDFMSEMNAIPNWDHCTWQLVPKSSLLLEPLPRYSGARLMGRIVNGGTGQKWGGRTKKGGVRVKNISVSVHNLYELNWETRRARWERWGANFENLEWGEKGKRKPLKDFLGSELMRANGGEEERGGLSAAHTYARPEKTPCSIGLAQSKAAWLRSVLPQKKRILEWG